MMGCRFKMFMITVVFFKFAILINNSSSLKGVRRLGMAAKTVVSASNNFVSARQRKQQGDRLTDTLNLNRACRTSLQEKHDDLSNGIEAGNDELKHYSVGIGNHLFTFQLVLWLVG